MSIGTGGDLLLSSLQSLLLLKDPPPPRSDSFTGFKGARGPPGIPHRAQDFAHRYSTAEQHHRVVGALELSPARSFQVCPPFSFFHCLSLSLSLAAVFHIFGRVFLILTSCFHSLLSCEQNLRSSDLSRFLYYFGNMQEEGQIGELSKMLQPRMVRLFGRRFWDTSCRGEGSFNTF